MHAILESDLDRVRADVLALAALQRGSAGPGERASASLVASRLQAAGAREVRVERFRYQGTYGWAHALHHVAGIAAAARGGLAGAAGAAAVLASLELEGSGRGQWTRRLLPAGEGANVAGVVPAAGARQAQLILVAHHDAARTGLVWHPRVAEAGAARRLRTRSIDPYLGPVGAALAAAAAGSLLGRRGRRLRAGAAAVLAAAAWLEADVARGAVVPGASDNATGVAAMLALVRRWSEDPLPGVEVIALAPGCEESGMGGMAAYLRRHPPDPARTLVLGLDTLGAGTPAVLRAEGPLLAWRYRDEDLALADAGAAAAGLPAPERWRIGGWTDPVLARFAGIPALSLISIGPKGIFTNYHRPTDTPDRVDWDSVSACLRLAAGIGQAWAAARG